MNLICLNIEFRVKMLLMLNFSWFCHLASWSTHITNRLIFPYKGNVSIWIFHQWPLYLADHRQFTYEFQARQRYWPLVICHNTMENMLQKIHMQIARGSNYLRVVKFLVIHEFTIGTTTRLKYTPSLCIKLVNKPGWTDPLSSTVFSNKRVKLFYGLSNILESNLVSVVKFSSPNTFFQSSSNSRKYITKFLLYCVS